MLTNIISLKRNINLNIADDLYPVEIINYVNFLHGFHLRECDKNFLNKYLDDTTRFCFDNDGNLKGDLHITDVIEFKTFDSGFAKAFIHKWDGDYDFKFCILNETPQIIQNIQKFEKLFADDILAVQLF